MGASSPTEVDISTDEFCRVYDELPLWSAPFGALLLEHVPLPRGGEVLDVGAGTGFLSVELAQRCGAASRVVAVDPWSAALRRPRSKVEFHNLANVELIESPLEDAGLAANRFDLIVSNLGVNNFADPARAVAECFRVARPHGAFALATNTQGHMQEFYEVYADVLKGVGTPAVLRALEEHIARRTTAGALVSLLETAGFEVQDTIERPFAMRFADGTALLNHHLVRLAFLPDWMAVSEDVDGVFESLERRLNEVALKRGELRLSVPMLYVKAEKRA